MKDLKMVHWGLIVLLVMNSFVFCINETGEAASPRNIYVKNTYPYPTGNGSADFPYQSIQRAIDLAYDGDTIYVFEGTYNETLLINKQISVIGLDQKNTTITKQGGSPRYLIQVTADYASIEGLNISDDAASCVRVALIYVQSRYLTIQDTHICDSPAWAIYLDSSTDNIIGYSNISYTRGIYSYYSDNNVISNNKFWKNTDAAINIIHAQSGIIYNNTFCYNTYGITAQDCSNLNISANKIRNNSFDGIKLSSGNSNLIKNNIFDRNKGNGLYSSASSSIILNNTVINNQVGITLAGSQCQVLSNIITSSSIWGLYAFTGTRGNIISLNEFSKNLINAQEDGQNQWYSNGKGNYWSDYNGVDRNLDRIGDAPYAVTGGARDIYPLGNFLKPPLKPSKPKPVDGADEVGLTVTLDVTVTDPDSSTLSVFFYRATDNKLMGYVRGIVSGESALCSFTLPFQTTFPWYTIVNDSKLENRSDIWIFTTRQIPPINKKPVANPGGPYQVNVGESLVFDSSKSYDPDLGGSLEFYRWDFGDGSSEILAQSPAHSYRDSGTFTVTLTVVDNDGRSSTNTTTVSVGSYHKNENPIANLTGLYSGEEKKPVFFNGAGSYDSDGTIVSYVWSFGDGTSGSGVITNHTFTKEGVYLVSLIVTDDSGGISQTSVTINIKSGALALDLPVIIVIVCVLLVVIVVVVLLLRRRNRGEPPEEDEEAVEEETESIS